MSTRLELIGIWLGIPGLVVACVVAFGTIFGFFGFEIKGPTTVLNEHIEEYDNFKTSADEIHSTQQQVYIDEVKHVESLARLTIRRSCVRDSYEELSIQGFIPACEEMGIIRRPNDRGTREATATGSPVDLEITAQPDTVSLIHPDTLLGPGG